MKIVSMNAYSKGLRLKVHCAGGLTAAVTRLRFSTYEYRCYIVGTDIEPGTYRNSGGRNCYWERLRGFNGGMNAIIANGGSNNPSIVTVAPTDAGFQSQGCGTWTKLE